MGGLRASGILAAVLAAVTLAACRTAGRTNHVDDDTDSDTGSDTGSDTASDTGSDTGQECEPGELFCQDGDIWECTGPDNQAELHEDCQTPETCLNGMCVTPDECGEALAWGTSLGCVYFAVDMDNEIPDQPYAIAVGTPGEAMAHVVVERKIGGVWQITDEADVLPLQTHVFLLGDTTVQGTFHLGGQAFRVTSDLPVVAYQFNPYSGLAADDSDVCSNDGTLLLATSVLGRVYYVLGYPDNTGSGSMDVVATEDDTQVTIRPSASISAGGTVAAMSAGQEVAFLMQEADVIQLRSSSGDISGTYVESDKPVAVFGGNTCAQVPTGVTYCDHLEHQLFPVAAWGREFVAARSPVRSIVQDPEKDTFRVIAAEDGTLVGTAPPIAGLDGATVNAGQVIEVAVDHSFTISASAPIMVGQYLTGHSATDVDFYGAGGDPAMALLPPVEQFLSDYVFLAPEKYELDYAVIAHPAGIDPDLDGQPASSNPECVTEILDADWEITRCLIPDLTHTVDADLPVGITVWGYGGRVSYGYTAGLSLEPTD